MDMCSFLTFFVLDYNHLKYFLASKKASNNKIEPTNQTSRGRDRPRTGSLQPSRIRSEDDGPQFDQQSVQSAPGELSPGNLSSKSFWTMDMLRQREKDATTDNTHTTLPPVTTVTTSSPTRQPLASGPFRRRVGSEGMEKPKGLLEKRQSLIETCSMSNATSLQHIHQASVVGGASSKPTTNKLTLNGLYGVPQSRVKRRHSLQLLPPLKKSSSEELY